MRRRSSTVSLFLIPPPTTTVFRSSSAAARIQQDLLKCSTEFHVEDGVDDRIQEAVHVAEPHEEREEHRVDLTDHALVEQVVADADGVDDVDREERNPARRKRAPVSPVVT